MPLKKKILFVASVERHLRHFHTPFIRYLQSEGSEVHTAAAGENEIPDIDRHYQIPFERSPYNLRNIRAYGMLKNLIRENGYRLVHCHTPNASVLTRLAGRKQRKNGLVMAYTSHGFHFYDGAPALYNTLYRGAEKFVSRYTDYILTINKEDYDAIERYGFRCGKAFLTHGMGIDAERFTPLSPERKAGLRESLGIDKNAFVLIYPAEYGAQKNQDMLIDAMASVTKLHKDIIALLPGSGPMYDRYRARIASMGLEDNVRLLGYKFDIENYMAVSDVDAAPSMREGMGLHIVESASSGLPCIATNIRGHRDVVRDGFNGFLVPLGSPEAMAEKILLLYNDRQLLSRLSENARENAEKYYLENTLAEHAAIYKEMLRAGDSVERSQNQRDNGGLQLSKNN